MLTHLEALLGTRIRLSEQVLNFLVVDLNHANRHLHLDSLGCVLLDHSDTLKDLIARTRHNAFILAIADN